MKWWIKERNNPQFDVYYCGMGQMSSKDAKKYEDALYGYNTMHGFNSEASYNAEMQRLMKTGKRLLDEARHA